MPSTLAPWPIQTGLVTPTLVASAPWQLWLTRLRTALNAALGAFGYARVAAGQTAAVTVATYTVGPSDGTFLVSANVLVTTATTHSFTVTCAYTDEGNTARTATLSFTLVAGGALVTTVANATGTVPYMGWPQHIRAKARTTITIATTGTFTAVVYNAEGLIVWAA